MTGHAREAIEEQVQSFAVRRRTTRARRRATGLGACRIGRAQGPFDAVIVVLADQPLIGASDLTELIGAFKKRSGGHVVVPVVEWQAGQPDRPGRGRAGADSRQWHQPRMPHLPSSGIPELVIRSTNRPTSRFVADLDTLDVSARPAAPAGGSNFQAWNRFGKRNGCSCSSQVEANGAREPGEAVGCNRHQRGRWRLSDCACRAPVGTLADYSHAKPSRRKKCACFVAVR